MGDNLVNEETRAAIVDTLSSLPPGGKREQCEQQVHAFNAVVTRIQTDAVLNAAAMAWFREVRLGSPESSARRVAAELRGPVERRKRRRVE